MKALNHYKRTAESSLSLSEMKKIDRVKCFSATVSEKIGVKRVASMFRMMVFTVYPSLFIIFIVSHHSIFQTNI